MKYLTVGTSEIRDDLFVKPEDTIATSVKPRGGLWLTQYHDERYNEWVDYILEDPVVLYYKSKGHSIWEQPCSLVTLKETANIFVLDSKESLDYLKQNYPLDDDKFSYEQIRELYDGIYVDMYKLLREVNDMRYYKFAVNSLLLFNLDCIESYQSGVVNIEPFDFEYGICEAPLYKIELEDSKKRVLKKD